MGATLNVFAAAHDVGVRRVVYRGSVSSLGWSLPDNTFMPEHLPIDEITRYTRSTVTGDRKWRARRSGGRTRTNTVSRSSPYAMSSRRRRDSWLSCGERGGKQHGRYIHYSYVEATDQARAARLAIETEYHSYEALFIATNDSCAPEPPISPPSPSSSRDRRQGCPVDRHEVGDRKWPGETETRLDAD